MIRLSSMGLGVALLALAGCGAPQENRTQAVTGNDVAPAATANAAPSVPAADPATAAAVPGALSCTAEIGAAAAQKLVKSCINTSPATHPPCNAANSCAMIEDEIARSCALFDGRGDPMPGCTPDPKSAAAAAAVVQRYYRALNARDYGTAWTLWGNDGPPGQTIAGFQAGFAATRATHVTIGTLPPGDAGAGSLYQPIPVSVDAELMDGTRQRFTGTYVVRRVNDVDGASIDQRRWHIDSATLKPAPTG